MDDMDRETPVTEDSATAGVDRSEQASAAVARAGRVLANPRRVRRA
jgi:hypothetical protein